MQTVRRIYIYLVALISLETVTWAVIGLARSLFAGAEIGGGVEMLAGALAFILVGVPVFSVHWWLAQRDLGDPEERFSLVRALFLYIALAALLIPVTQNFLALIERSLALALGVSRDTIAIGSYQSWSDNLTAIVINALIAVYIFNVVRKDWAAKPTTAQFADIRRIYRHFWMLYALAWCVAGVNRLFYYVFGLFEVVGKIGQTTLVDALGFVLLGVPLWWYVWNILQTAAESDEAEQESLLRQSILYAVTFISVVAVVVAGGVLLSWLLRAVLGENISSPRLLNITGETLAVLVPFAAAWAVYGRVVRGEVEALQDEPRQAGLRRLYAYVLSLIGLGAAFGGIVSLLAVVVDLLFGDIFSMPERLGNSLAALAVGVPLWLRFWLPMMRQAAAEDAAGDHARRSVIRKGYLYIALFTGVMGVMISIGGMFYQLFLALLGDADPNFTQQVVNLLATGVLFAVLLFYHWRALRADGQRAMQLLAAQHAEFSAAVFEPGEGEFAEHMVAALKKLVPDVPVAVHPVGEPIDASLVSAGAVILPASLATAPPEAIRLWLEEFEGARVVVPDSSAGWLWVGMAEDKLDVLGRRAAQVVRGLAEGQDSLDVRVRTVWTMFGYAFAGIAGVAILCTLFSLLMETLNF